MVEAWTTVRTGDWLWLGSALDQVSSIAGGRVRARGSTRRDTEAANRVDFQPGEVIDIAKHGAPLLFDTAETTKDGLYSMDADEYSMLLDVARDRDSSGGEPAASNSRRTDRSGSDSTSEADGAGDERGEYEGCRDVESLTPLHQILPYSSQFRDTTSSAGHAWVNADISNDDQVKDAVTQVEATIRRHMGAQPLVLSAYSDGSVTGRGVAGSAAIVIETADGASIRRQPAQQTGHKLVVVLLSQTCANDWGGGSR